MIPGEKVGLVIGRKGESINRLQSLSGAKIVIIQDSAVATTEKPLRITGSPESVQTAKQLVGEFLAKIGIRDGRYMDLNS